MPIIFALIGGLIMGAIGNSATGIISFLMILLFVSSFEDQEAIIRLLRERVRGLEVEKFDLEHRIKHPR